MCIQHPNGFSKVAYYVKFQAKGEDEQYEKGSQHTREIANVFNVETSVRTARHDVAQYDGTLEEDVEARHENDEPETVIRLVKKSTHFFVMSPPTVQLRR